MSKVELVRNAMLAVQRFCWEQGTCMQALYELGDETTAFAMAHDAVKRQAKDGRLAISDSENNSTDPACNGEVVYRAGVKTGDPFYINAAKGMLSYLLEKAPKTENGTLSHVLRSWDPQSSNLQIWVDSVDMAPPFLAVMGKVEEAWKQIQGIIGYLKDPETGVLFHMYDAGRKVFMRQKLWATGNGWALLGMARVLDEALLQGKNEIAKEIEAELNQLLVNLLKYQLSNGLFYDILDDPDSFEEGTSAMMMAAVIFRGVLHGYVDPVYLENAQQVVKEMKSHVDDLGLIHGVAGCPDFVREGTSAESMAAYLMMHAWRNQLQKQKK